VTVQYNLALNESYADSATVVRPPLEPIMTQLKTNESLLSALRKASSRVITAEELHKQRVSFIMGSTNAKSGVTRAKIQQVLDKQEGQKGS